MSTCKERVLALKPNAQARYVGLSLKFVIAEGKNELSGHHLRERDAWRFAAKRLDGGRMQSTIFVYGTLKRGHSNHRLLEGAEFIGVDQAPGVVYGGNRFVPVAQPCEEERWIIGEVYRVDAETLKRLDRLEGHPHAYTRTPVKLRSGLDAEIYYWLGEIVSWNVQPIASGEWGK